MHVGIFDLDMDENLGLGGVCSMYVSFYLEHDKVVWGHSVHFSEKRA